jgi:hypothetical protein
MIVIVHKNRRKGKKNIEIKSADFEILLNIVVGVLMDEMKCQLRVAYI